MIWQMLCHKSNRGLVKYVDALCLMFSDQHCGPTVTKNFVRFLRVGLYSNPVKAAFFTLYSFHVTTAFFVPVLPTSDFVFTTQTNYTLRKWKIIQRSTYLNKACLKVASFYYQCCDIFTKPFTCNYIWNLNTRHLLKETSD